MFPISGKPIRDYFVNLNYIESDVKKMECAVKLIWDQETDRWHSESDDKLCITLEAASFDVLVERIRVAAPEMLELNCGYKGPIKLNFEVERVETLNMVS